MMFGPGSVFAGKKNEIKKESISRMASSSNMFSMLSSQTAEIADSTAKRTSPLSMDL
jgi:translation initiation factor 4G